MIAVEEAVPRYTCPTKVEDPLTVVVAKVEVPCTVRSEVKIPLVKVRPVPEIPVVEAVAKYVCPDTENAVEEAFWNDEKAEATVDVATKLDAVTIPSINAFPATESLVVGVVVPIPRLPPLVILTFSVKFESIFPVELRPNSRSFPVYFMYLI